MKEGGNSKNDEGSSEFAKTISDKWLINVSNCPTMDGNVPRFPKNRHGFGIPKVTKN
jgi:hypothetical protein